MAVFLAMIVMPFSRSRSMESRMRSGTVSLARKIPLCHSMASTSVVLPWSTWAMIARLRRSGRVAVVMSIQSNIRPDDKMGGAGDHGRSGYACRAMARAVGGRDGVARRPSGRAGEADAPIRGHRHGQGRRDPDRALPGGRAQDRREL